MTKTKNRFGISNFGSAFGGLFVCYLLFVIWNFYSSNIPVLQGNSPSGLSSSFNLDLAKGPASRNFKSVEGVLWRTKFGSWW